MNNPFYAVPCANSNVRKVYVDRKQLAAEQQALPVPVMLEQQYIDIEQDIVDFQHAVEKHSYLKD